MAESVWIKCHDKLFQLQWTQTVESLTGVVTLLSMKQHAANTAEMGCYHLQRLCKQSSDNLFAPGISNVAFCDSVVATDNTALSTNAAT